MALNKAVMSLLAIEIQDDEGFKDRVMERALRVAQGEKGKTVVGRRLLYELLVSGEERARGVVVELMTKEVTDWRVFQVMARELIRAGYFPESLEKFIHSKASVDFLKQILSGYPKSFEQTVEVMAQLDEDEVRLLAGVGGGEGEVGGEESLAQAESLREDILAALEDLEVFGVQLFRYFRSLDSKNRKKLREKVDEVALKIFGTEDYEEVVLKNFKLQETGDSEALLLEMVMACFRPEQMREEVAKKLMEQIRQENPDELKKFLATYNLEGQPWELRLGEVEYVWTSKRN